MSNSSLKKFFIIILFFLIFIQAFLVKTSNRNEKIHIVFRMDDFSDNSNVKVEEKILEIFSTLSIPLIVGIVPFTINEKIEPINQEKIGLISKYKNVDFFTFALHGYTHKNNSLDRRFKYEFNYLPFDTQIKKLSEGKIFLESITERKIIVFIPPWNGYDSNTVSGMEKTGFKTISAGLRGLSINSTIDYLPLTTTIKELKEIFQEDHNIRIKDVIVVVNLHAYEFETIEDLNNVEKLLKDLKNNRKVQFLDYRSATFLNSQSFNLNKQFQYLLSLIPKFWGSSFGYHSFYLIPEKSVTFYEKCRFVLTIFNYIFSVFFISFLFFYYFLKKFLVFINLKALIFFVISIFIVFSILIFSNSRINSRGVTILISLSGILSSLVLIMKTKK